MHLYRVVLPVSDIERATAFYSSLLGRPGTRVAVGQHSFDCEGTVLTVHHVRADIGPRGDGRSHPHHIYIAVDNLEHLHGHAFYVPGGVVEPTIETHESGERCFEVRDPFGNLLCFVDRATVFTQTER